MESTDESVEMGGLYFHKQSSYTYHLPIVHKTAQKYQIRNFLHSCHGRAFYSRNPQFAFTAKTSKVQLVRFFKLFSDGTRKKNKTLELRTLRNQ